MPLRIPQARLRPLAAWFPLQISSSIPQTDNQPQYPHLHSYSPYFAPIEVPLQPFLSPLSGSMFGLFVSKLPSGLRLGFRCFEVSLFPHSIVTSALNILYIQVRLILLLFSLPLVSSPQSTLSDVSAALRRIRIKSLLPGSLHWLRR